MEDPDVNPCIVKENIIVDGFLYSPVTIYSNKGDVYDIFKVSTRSSLNSDKWHIRHYDRKVHGGGGLAKLQEFHVSEASPPIIKDGGNPNPAPLLIALSNPLICAEWMQGHACPSLSPFQTSMHSSQGEKNICLHG